MGEVPAVVCTYCRQVFTSIGLGPDAEHDWIRCSEDIADKYHRLLERDKAFAAYEKEVFGR